MRPTTTSCFLIGLAYAWGGCALIIIGLIFAHKNYRFSQEGFAANATVTALTSKQSSKGAEYDVAYLYQDSSGTIHAAKNAVSFSEWKNLLLRGSLPILFLRTDPTTNRINLPDETKVYHDNGTTMPLFGGFIASVGTALVIVSWIARRYPTPISHVSPARHLWPAMGRPKAYKFHKTY